METRARYVLVGLFLLLVIAAGFGFVFWLHNTGGLGERTAYQVRFQSAIMGLQPGSSVLFNGIKVGEVIALRLNRDVPKQVTATIAVEPDTPIRVDTEVGVAVQGLMGSPAITLKGGNPAAPPLKGVGGQLPMLTAEPNATQDTMQAAREVLQRIDKVIAENAEPLKGTIANIKVFSDALARNSNRVDTVMDGLAHMLGAQAAGPAKIYDLTAIPSFAPVAKMPDVQLGIPDPTAVIALDTRKILERLPSGEISSLPDVQWSDNLPKMFQAKLIQSFENAKFMGIAKPSDAFMADRQLTIDIRTFEIAKTGAPMAKVAFSAKVVADGKVVGARLFEASVPVKGSDAQAAARALDDAFGKTATPLVEWTLGLI